MQSAEVKQSAQSSFTRKIIENFAGQAVPLVVAVFAIRFLLHQLNEDRFGLLTLAWAVIGYFSLFDLGIGRALTQIVAEKLGAGETKDLSPLIVQSLLLMLGLGILGGSLMAALNTLLVYRFLTIPANLQTEALYSFHLLAAAIPIVVLTAGVRGIMEAQQNFTALSWIRIALGFYTYLAPLAVLPFSHSTVPIIIVLIIGRVIALWVSWKICLRTLPPLQWAGNFSLQQIRPLLKFGGWMTLSNIIGPFMVYMDRFFIGAFVAVSAVTYYVTPYEVVTKLWLIPSAICGVLFPAFAMHFSQNADRVNHLFEQGLKYVFLAVFPLSLLIVMLAPEGLSLWLGKSYAQQSTPIAQWLTIGVFINCLAQVAFALIQGIGRPDLTAKLHLLELPIYLICLVSGVKYLGVKGAAIAWAVRVTIDACLLFFFAFRLFELKRKLLVEILSVVLIASATLFIGLMLQSLSSRLGFMVITLLSLGIVAWLRFFSSAEKEMLRKGIGLFSNS